MKPIKVDDKLINLSQATYIDLKYTDGEADPSQAARIYFGPGKFLVIFDATAEKFRKLPELTEWTQDAIVIGDMLINPDQIAHADLKFRNNALLPRSVKDAVHVVFSAGNEITLTNEKAAMFREGYKQLPTK